MKKTINLVFIAMYNQVVTLYNVHPESSNILVYLQERAPVAHMLSATFKMRQLVFQRLMADIASRPGPVIVVGDFNSTDQSDVYAVLTGKLTEAHRAAGWGFGHTFPAYTGWFRGLPIIPRQMRLDMVFYSDAFVAVASRVGTTSGESDHLPVLAKLAWREEQGW